MTRQREGCQEGEKRDATTAATPAQPRTAAVAAYAAGAPNANADATPFFYAAGAAAPCGRLAQVRSHLAPPGPTWPVSAAACPPGAADDGATPDRGGV
jgi:hypothetical protein